MKFRFNLRRDELAGTYVLFNEDHECLYVGETENILDRLRHHSDKPWANVSFIHEPDQGARLSTEARLIATFGPTMQGVRRNYSASANSRGHTKLRKYVTDGESRQYEFAQALRTTPANVSRWLSGKAKPLDEMKRRIEAATGGAVPASDWLVPEASDEAAA